MDFLIKIEYETPDSDFRQTVFFPSMPVMAAIRIFEQLYVSAEHLFSVGFVEASEAPEDELPFSSSIEFLDLCY